MKLFSALLIFVLCTGVSGAQQKPQPKIDWAFLVSDSAVRGMDVYSTHRMLQRGGYELFLPDAISHHVPVMAAYSAAAVATNVFVASRLAVHHPKLTRVLEIVEVTDCSYWVVNNLRINGRR